MRVGKVFVSDEPAPAIVWQSLGHFFVDRLANARKDSVVFVDDASGREWRGAELSRRILSIATALVDQLQFEQGTVVVICYEHSAITCVLALAVICAGGVVASLPTYDPYAELLYMAKKVDPKFLFCSKDKLRWCEQLTKDLGRPVRGVAMDGPADEWDPFSHLEHLLNYERPASESAVSVPLACRDISKDFAFILMSSGTTGKPKAVSSTHQNCFMDIGSLCKLELDDYRFSGSNPLYYVSFRLTIMDAIASSASVVFFNSSEPAGVAKAIQMRKISFLVLGNSVLYKLITFKELHQYDISSVRGLTPGGSKMVFLDELGAFLSKYPHIALVQMGYGCSEGGVLTRVVRTCEDFLEDSDCCGRLRGGIRIKLVDPETGELLGVKQHGLVHTAGPNMFLGYYDISLAESNPDGLPLLRDSTVFDEEGFYKTGDIAYMNEREELYVLGRQKETMLCRTLSKVLPQELEEIVSQHPAVSQVCVLGVQNRSDPVLQCPRAFVVLRAQHCQGEFAATERLDPSREAEPIEHRGVHKLSSVPKELRRRLAEDIMLFTEDRISWEKQLTGGIVILDELPALTSSGKVDKSHLKTLSEEEVELFGDRSS